MHRLYPVILQLVCRYVSRRSSFPSAIAGVYRFVDNVEDDPRRKFSETPTAYPLGRLYLPLKYPRSPLRTVRSVANREFALRFSAAAVTMRESHAPSNRRVNARDISLLFSRASKIPASRRRKIESRRSSDVTFHRRVSDKNVYSIGSSEPNSNGYDPPSYPLYPVPHPRHSTDVLVSAESRSMSTSRCRGLDENAVNAGNRKNVCTCT